MSAMDIVSAARALRGVRFHHQGRSMQTGVDCLGLLVLVAEKCALRMDGVPLHARDRTDYGHNPDVMTLRAALDAALMQVDVETMQAGDVGLFLVDKRPQHLAIITDYPMEDEFGMIHAYAPQRKVIEHRLDAQWKDRLVGLYRFADS